MTTITQASLQSVCDLHICSMIRSWDSMLRGSKRHNLDENGSLSVICQYITSSGEHALACSLLYSAASGRNRESTYFQNNFSNDWLNSVKLFQVCQAGGYYDHKKNGNIQTCPFAQCPDELHSLSPFSLQPINSWGCPSNSESCLQTPRASLLWLEMYLFFFSSNIFPKEKKQKAKEDHNKINAWQLTQSKIF